MLHSSSTFEDKRHVDCVTLAIDEKDDSDGKKKLKKLRFSWCAGSHVQNATRIVINFLELETNAAFFFI